VGLGFEHVGDAAKVVRRIPGRVAGASQDYFERDEPVTEAGDPLLVEAASASSNSRRTRG
jgi:hypothetical protein